MGFVPKDWINETDHAGPPASPPGTPISAAALEDVEGRLSAYSREARGLEMGVYNVVDYGADPTGVAYSDDAFTDALDEIRALTVPTSNSGAILWVPQGSFKLANTLSIDRQIIVAGCGGPGWYPSSRIVFDTDTTGIQVESATTSADGGNGAWSVIRDLNVMSSRTVGSTADGINLVNQAKVENVWVYAFSRRGINIQSDIAGYSNNLWQLQNCFLQECGGHGLYVAGNDSNAGYALGVNCYYNGMWGIFDRSFLGNTYLACHTNGNGQRSTGYDWDPITTTLNGAIDADDATIVLTSVAGLEDTGGVIYIAAEGGNTAEYIGYTGISGSSITGCYRAFSPASSPSAHSNGASVTVLYGGYMSQGAVSNTAWVNCYTEDGQGAPDFQKAGYSFGAMGGNKGKFPGAYLGGGSPRYGASVAFNEGRDDGAYTQFAPNNGADGAIKFFSDSANGDISLYWSNDLTSLNWERAGTDFLNFANGGHATMPPGGVHATQGLWMNGDHHITYGNAAPGSGTHAQGDIVFNYNAAPEGYAGWICTTGGTPGTWKAFGLIAA